MATSIGDGTVFGNALSDIFNSVLAVDAVYTPVTGAAVSCRIIINKNTLLQPTSMEAQVWDQGTTIEVILADIGNVEPNRGSTFVADGTTYTVQSVKENDGEVVEVVVT